MSHPPAPHQGHQGNKLDGAIGKAVDNSLLVAGVRSTRKQRAGGQSLQAVGEYVGGNALKVFCQEGSKAARAPAKHRVSQDDQAPPIAKSFEGEVDGAS